MWDLGRPIAPVVEQKEEVQKQVDSVAAAVENQTAAYWFAVFLVWVGLQNSALSAYEMAVLACMVGKMLAVVRRNSAKGGRIALDADHALLLSPGQFRLQHRGAVVSSLGAIWVLEQQVRRDCMPWAGNYWEDL